MRALVTGATGFLGRALCDELARARWRVFAAGRRTHGDLADPAVASSLLQAAKPDVVFHLAGGRSTAPGVERRLTETLLWGVLAERPRARVVIVTSAAVYGPRGVDAPPLREDAPLRPASAYGRVKAEVHGLAAAFAHRLDVVEARPFNAIGPGAPEGTVLGDVCAKLARGERAVRVGSVTPVRDFVDVRDVARAFRRIAERGRRGEVYHVCIGEGRTVRELLEALARAAGPFRWRAAPAVADVSVGNPEKIRRELGWKPEVAFAQSVADAWASWATRGAGARPRSAPAPAGSPPRGRCRTRSPRGGRLARRALPKAPPGRARRTRRGGRRG